MTQRQGIWDNMTAVVADDDASIRRMCRRLLKREGINVIEASDGVDAIAAVEANQPDLILLDVLMPQLDGHAVARKLRSDPLLTHVPIVMITGADSHDEILAGLEAGADEYLTKPLDPRELRCRIRSVANLRHAWRNVERSYNVLGEQSRALGLLQDFSASLARTEELDAILEYTLDTAATLTSSRRISILLPATFGGHLYVAQWMGIPDRIAASTRVPIGRGVCGEVFATGSSRLIPTSVELQEQVHRSDALLINRAPVISAAMCASEQTIGVLNVSHRVGKMAYSEQDLNYLTLCCNYAAAAIETVHNRRSRDKARDSIVFALAKLAEHRDDDTGKHLDRVTVFCKLLAEDLRRHSAYAEQIDDRFIKNLERAAPLHDIGKVAVPDAILLKPARLNAREIEIMRKHVDVGTETIRSVLERTPDSEFLKMAEEIASGHHEWYDGRGYPKGVQGQAIPLSARVLALADVYDALTTKRVYKDAMPHSEARSIIIESAGTQFDPVIIEAFVRTESEFIRLARELADEPAAFQETGIGPVDPATRDVAVVGVRA